MAIAIRQIHKHFVGEVSGVDLRQPLTKDEATAIEAGMDKYAVLVFRNQQHISDEQQLAFTKSLGPIEHAIGTSLRAASETRLPTTFADVSNLDKNQQVLALDDRQRLFAILGLLVLEVGGRVVAGAILQLHVLAIAGDGQVTEGAVVRQVRGFEADDVVGLGIVLDLLKSWAEIVRVEADRRTRRQQLMPEPQPISAGSISHGRPERSTNRMPVSAARSDLRGRPPFGLAVSGGSSGAISAHRPSGRSGLAISPQRAPTGFVRGSKSKIPVRSRASLDLSSSGSLWDAPLRS